MFLTDFSNVKASIHARNGKVNFEFTAMWRGATCQFTIAAHGGQAAVIVRLGERAGIRGFAAKYSIRLGPMNDVEAALSDFAVRVENATTRVFGASLPTELPSDSCRSWEDWAGLEGKFGELVRAVTPLLTEVEEWEDRVGDLVEEGELHAHTFPPFLSHPTHLRPRRPLEGLTDHAILPIPDGHYELSFHSKEGEGPVFGDWTRHDKAGVEIGASKWSLNGPVQAPDEWPFSQEVQAWVNEFYAANPVWDFPSGSRMGEVLDRLEVSPIPGITVRSESWEVAEVIQHVEWADAAGQLVFAPPTVPPWGSIPFFNRRYACVQRRGVWTDWVEREEDRDDSARPDFTQITAYLNDFDRAFNAADASLNSDLARHDLGEVAMGLIGPVSVCLRQGFRGPQVVIEAGRLKGVIECEDFRSGTSTRPSWTLAYPQGLQRLTDEEAEEKTILYRFEATNETLSEAFEQVMVEHNGPGTAMLMSTVVDQWREALIASLKQWLKAFEKKTELDDLTSSFLEWDVPRG